MNAKKTTSVPSSSPARTGSAERAGKGDEFLARGCVVDSDADRRPRKIAEEEMADRGTKERKLVALMLDDLGIDVESEVVKMEQEVRSLSDEELDETLAGRLDLPHPVDAEVLDRVLARVEEPERLSEKEPGGFTGAPDMSHEPRPEEREG